MEHSTHTTRGLRLASGEVVAEATTAYRTLGRLNAAGDNAVLVLHGYTTGPSMLDPGANVAEGSWSELVGPGRPIDTGRWAEGRRSNHPTPVTTVAAPTPSNTLPTSV